MQAVPQGALAYFNCGPESGASQPHKHIQVQQVTLLHLMVPNQARVLALASENDLVSAPADRPIATGRRPLCYSITSRCADGPNLARQWAL